MAEDANRVTPQMEALVFNKGRKSSHFSRGPLGKVLALLRSSQEDFHWFELLF